MVDPQRYRSRLWAATRAGAAERLGARWGVLGLVAVPVLAAVIAYAVAAAFEKQAMSPVALLAGIVGAVAGALLWVGFVYLVSFIAAPAQLDRLHLTALVAAHAELALALQKIASTEANAALQESLDIGAHVLDLVRTEGSVARAVDADDWAGDAERRIARHCTAAEVEEFRRGLPMPAQPDQKAVELFLHVRIQRLNEIRLRERTPLVSDEARKVLNQ